MLSVFVLLGELSYLSHLKLLDESFMLYCVYHGCVLL